MSETTRLGVSIAAVGASTAEAQIKSLENTIKGFQNEISRLTNRDDSGPLIKILEKEANAVRAQIAAIKEQQNAIKSTTAALQEQAKAYELVHRSLQQNIDLANGSSADRMIKSAAESAKTLEMALSAAAEADSRLRGSIEATTAALRQQEATLKMLADARAEANYINRDMDMAAGHTRSSAIYENRDRDLAAAKARAEAEYTNENIELIKKKERAEAEYINAGMTAEAAKARAEAEYENKNIELIEKKKRAEAEYINQSIDAAAAKARAEAEYINQMLQLQLQQARQEAEFINQNLELIRAKARAEAEYIEADLELIKSKQRAEAEYINAGLEAARAKQRAEAEYANQEIELIKQKQRAEAEYINAGMDAAAAKARAEAQYANQEIDLIRAKQRAEAEYINANMDAEYKRDRALAEFEEASRQQAYVNMRKEADIENASFNARMKSRPKASGGGGDDEVEAGARRATVEMRHLVAAFDEISRGQRGALFSTIGAAARDAGIGVAGLATSVGGLVAVMGASAILHQAEELSKWATELRANAAAVGMSISDYSGLQAVLVSMGLKADEANTSLRHLADTLSQALADPTSKAAQAFHNMTISQDDLKKNGPDVAGALRLLSDAFARTANDADKTANMTEIFGRGFEKIIPLIQGGSGALDAQVAKQKEFGRVVGEETVSKLEHLGTVIHDTADAISGPATQAFANWAPAIEKVVRLLGDLAGILIKIGGLTGSLVSAVVSTGDMSAAKIAATASAGQARLDQEAPNRIAGPNSPLLPEGSWQTINGRREWVPGASPQPAVNNNVVPVGPPTGGTNALPSQGSATGLIAVQPLMPKEKGADVTAIELMRQQMTAAALGASKGGDRQAEAKAEIAVMQQTLDTAKLTAKERAEITTEMQQKEIQLNNSTASAGEKAFKQSYEDFAANERLKVSEAQGNSAQIIAIYNEWEKAATSNYKQAASVAIAIEKEKVQAINAARLSEIKEGAQLEERLNRSSLVMGQANAIGSGTMRYPGQPSIGGREPSGEGTAALAAQAQAIEASAQQEVSALTEVMNTAAKGSDTQKAAAQEILSVVTEAKSQEVALYNKAAEAAITAANKSMEGFNKFFDSLGTQFESFTNSLLRALIAPQQELIKQGLTTIKRSEGQNEIKQAISKMLLGAIDDGMKGVEATVSKTLANMLSSALSIPMQPGGGLSSLFSAGLSKLFGGSVGGAVGGLPSAAQFGLAATSLTTAGTTLNTAALTLGTAATALSAAAATSATASAAGGVSDAGGFLGLASLFAFSGGGVVPSAAGGMVNGMGATLSLLHPQEMVLPAHLSNGIQSMINGGRNGSQNANLNYSPTINTASRSRGGTGMTRSEFGQMMASHSGAMMGEARNMMRNGWRPAG